jgi:hypothetical protein
MDRVDAREAYPGYRSAMAEALSAWERLGVVAITLIVDERDKMRFLVESTAPDVTRRQTPPVWDDLPVDVEPPHATHPLSSKKSVRMALPGR